MVERGEGEGERTMGDKRMKIYVGMPQHNDTPLLDACAKLNSPIMLSANRCWNNEKQCFQWGHAALHSPSDVMIDSSGFVAMARYGGYRWTAETYLEWIVNGWPDSWPRPIYAAMDFCCEREIADSREKVLSRIDRTVEMCWYMFELIDQMREDGMHWAEYPMPVIQGWHPEDYIRCLERLPPAKLYGVGSVCRRPLKGEAGLLRVLDAIGRHLPDDAKLHGFGIKGTAMPHVLQMPYVASVDSMAWDAGLRHQTSQDVSRSYALRAASLVSWQEKQASAKPLAQGRLF